VSVSGLPVSLVAYWAVLIGVFVTAFYSFRMFFLVFHGAPRMDKETESHVHESPWVVTVPLTALAVPSVLAGNVVQPLARFVLGVGALGAGYAVMGLVVTLIASVGLAAVVAGVFLARMLSEAERGVKGREPPGPMIRFGLLQMGASILGIKTLGLGILMLGWLQDDLQVGLFAAALALQGPANAVAPSTAWATRSASSSCAPAWRNAGSTSAWCRRTESGNERSRVSHGFARTNADRAFRKWIRSGIQSLASLHSNRCSLYPRSSASIRG
jgi:NADH:ubiquinone oxidoreductase subunit 5 (subunit L)/multisubunit Na+/H+ antiporter MnhA subunit